MKNLSFEKKALPKKHFLSRFGKEGWRGQTSYLGFLNFKPIEIKIYNFLLTSSLTIKQIQNLLNLSERTIRKYIQRLDQE
ncbi:hypothetical protein C4E24_05730 [ANME-1 cluster archaeon AG-394-G21]|nr:hypothetical protein [ANME-1 cluster archaeon AG-394-G21]